MKIGYKIKNLRESKNIPRKKVAIELGMSEEGYAKIERNLVGVNSERLLKLSQLMDVPLEDFFNQECTVINNPNLNDNSQGGNGVVINNLPEKYIESLQELVSSLKRENELQKFEIERLKNQASAT